MAVNDDKKKESALSRFSNLIFNKYTMLMVASLEMCLMMYMYNKEGLINVFSAAKEQNVEKIRSAKCFKVCRRDITGTKKLIGQIKAMSEVSLKPRGQRTMTIKAIKKIGGSEVTKGEVIFEFYDPEVEKTWYVTRAEALTSCIQFENALKANEDGAKVYSSNDIVKLKEKREVNLNNHLGAIAVKDKNTKIRAPFDGIIGIHDLTVGQSVSPDKELTKIIDSNNLILVFYFTPGGGLAKIKPGEIILYSIGDDGALLEARITEISPYLEETHNKIKVKAIILKDDPNYEDAKDKIRINGFVNVFIPKTAINGVKVVHTDAIVENEGKQFVVKVVRQNNILVTKMVPVVTLDAENELVAIESGDITENDFIVVHGPKRGGVRVNIGREGVLNANN